MKRTIQQGATLIELIIAIVIISIALVGILVVMNRTTSRSADPLILDQSVAIANAYLEEIIARPFADPDGTEAGETRSSFDDVDDYNNLTDVGARDQFNNPITGLEQYTISVSVSGEALAVGALTADAANSKRITITVTHPAQSGVSISTYRTNY